MCLLAFSIHNHPNYPFILVSNRDEAYDRSAVPLHTWLNYPEVTGGLDLKEKGTWLGYTKQGKFATLLNHPFTDWQPDLDPPRSRGHLLKDYLTHDFGPGEFERVLKASRRRYNSYHLLYGSFDDLHYYTNAGDKSFRYQPGLYSLANTQDDLSRHRLDKSACLLKDYLASHEGDIRLEDLTQLMTDQEQAKTLPNLPPSLSPETAKERSSIFIKGEEFGTVATTALLVDQAGIISVREVRYDQTGVTEVTEKVQRLTL